MDDKKGREDRKCRGVINFITATGRVLDRGGPWSRPEGSKEYFELVRGKVMQRCPLLMRVLQHQTYRLVCAAGFWAAPPPFDDGQLTTMLALAVHCRGGGDRASTRTGA